MVEKEKDIVERLRLKADIVDGLVKRGVSTQSATMREAADEIERLREALEKIANADGYDGWGFHDWAEGIARAALKDKP